MSSGSDSFGLWRAVSKQVDLRVDQYDGKAREGELVVDSNPGPNQYQLYIGTSGGNLVPVSGGGGGNAAYANTANVANVANSVAGANVLGPVLDANHANVADVANSVAGANVVGQVADSAHADVADTADNLDAAGAANVRVGGGTAGQVLKSDGLGGMIWATDDSAPAPPDMSIQFNKGGAFDGDPSFIFDASVLMVTAPNVTVTGESNLGPVANVKITGGTSGQVLTTDGSGGLSWATAGGTPWQIANGTSDLSFAAVNGALTGNLTGVRAFNIDGGAANYQIAIGSEAGHPNQEYAAIAIGPYAAGSAASQKVGAIAIGEEAGYSGQQSNAIAIGFAAGIGGGGSPAQGQDSIAIGNTAGAEGQGNRAISIGHLAGKATQGESSIAVGSNSGFDNQGGYSVAIGSDAASSLQGESAVAIGAEAGSTQQGINAVAIGRSSGVGTQGANAIAIGYSSGLSAQGNSSVAVGKLAGSSSQGVAAVAIGSNAGRISQGANAIAIGSYAGQNNQGANSIILNATGAVLENTTADSIKIAPVRNDLVNTTQALYYNTTTKEVTYAPAGGGTPWQIANGTSDLSFATLNGALTGNLSGSPAFFIDGAANWNIAIGVNAGSPTQAYGAVAMGPYAGNTNQGTQGIAIGDEAGTKTQGASAIAIGVAAGSGYGGSQGGNAIAIGRFAGADAQGANSISLGSDAGKTNQGANSIAIGANAGVNSQAPNSIVLNATGAVLNNTTAGSLVIAPVRADATNTAQALYYNTTTKEVTYNAVTEPWRIANGNSNVSLAIAAGPITGYSNGKASLHIDASVNLNIAIGANAGLTAQDYAAIAIGVTAGRDTQASQAIAIGEEAGFRNQGVGAIAIGTAAGVGATVGQGGNAIAIGRNAGAEGQGANAIAIGSYAGQNNQGANSIIINATGALLNNTTADSLTISPIRNDLANTAQALYYNTTTKEVTYAPAGGGGGTPAGANTEIQFNDSGVFGAKSTFTFDKATDTVTVKDIDVTGNVLSSLLPDANITHDLGSPTQRWRDLYLSNNTIYMGDQEIAANATHLILTVAGNNWTFSQDQLAVPEGGAVTFPKNNTIISESVLGAEVNTADLSTQTVTGTGSGGTVRVRYTPGAAFYTRADGRATGTGYVVGDQVRVLGSELGGTDGVNDLIAEVVYVDGAGAIDYGPLNIISGTPVAGPPGMNIETDGDNWSFANRTFTVPGDIQSDGVNDLNIICNDPEDDGLVMALKYNLEGTVTSSVELEDGRVNLEAEDQVDIRVLNNTASGYHRWAFGSRGTTGVLALIDNTSEIETNDDNLNLVACKSSTFANGNDVSLISRWNTNNVEWTKATVGYQNITLTTNMGRGGTEYQWTFTQGGALQLPEYNNEKSSLIGTRNTITTAASPIIAPAGTPTTIYTPTSGIYSYKAIVTIKHDTGGSIDIETFEVMASMGATSTVFTVSNRLNTYGSGGGLNDATVTIGAGFELIIDTKYGTTNTVTFAVTEFN